MGTCSNCCGGGVIMCPTCGGSDYFGYDDDGNYGEYSCPTCGGNSEEECPECNGSGDVEDD